MTNQTLAEQVKQFGETIFRWNAAYDEYSKSIGLTYSRLLILELLSTNPDTCTQKLLCEKTFFPKQTVNGIITDFVKQGLVKLEDIPSDRRNKLILQTESGKEIIDKMVSKSINAAYKAMERLDETQREALIANTTLYVTHCQELLLNKED